MTNIELDLNGYIDNAMSADDVNKIPWIITKTVGTDSFASIIECKFNAIWILYDHFESWESRFYICFQVLIRIRTRTWTSILIQPFNYSYVTTYLQRVHSAWILWQYDLCLPWSKQHLHLLFLNDIAFSFLDLRVLNKL